VALEVIVRVGVDQPRPRPVFGFRASEIAENIYQAFATETTETKLSVAELEVALRVAEFCSRRANQEPCSGKFE
jgi:nicotinamide mononucleotide adenylyltransferase